MLPLSQKSRLKALRSIFSWDVAQAKQQGQTFEDEKEELDVLSMMKISSDVANTLNEDVVYRRAPTEKAEALTCVISTALKGLESLLKEDPELAYLLGIQIQAELERSLKGSLDDDGKENRFGSRGPTERN